MDTKLVKLVCLLVLVTLTMGILASTVLAANNDEVFESQNYYTYSGKKDGVYSLTYIGRGCPGANDKNDYRFKVNINRSTALNDWKFYSADSKYQKLPSGRLFKGYNLDTNAYVCIGATEFIPWSGHWTWWWTTAGVEKNVYVWRR